MTPNHEAQLLAKAESRTALMGVVGLGYVGLPLAVELAEAGYHVIGFDVSARVVDGVSAGRSHVQDIPTERLAKLVRGGKLTATTDLARLKEPDAIAICVPTPLVRRRFVPLGSSSGKAHTIRQKHLQIWVCSLF